MIVLTYHNGLGPSSPDYFSYAVNKSRLEDDLGSVLSWIESASDVVAKGVNSAGHGPTVATSGKGDLHVLIHTTNNKVYGCDAMQKTTGQDKGVLTKLTRR